MSPSAHTPREVTANVVKQSPRVERESARLS